MLLGRYETAAAGSTGGGFGMAAGDEPPQPHMAIVASTTHHVQRRLGNGWYMRTGSGLASRLPVGSSILLVKGEAKSCLRWIAGRFSWAPRDSAARYCSAAVGRRTRAAVPRRRRPSAPQ